MPDEKHLLLKLPLFFVKDGVAFFTGEAPQRVIEKQVSVTKLRILIFMAVLEINKCIDRKEIRSKQKTKIISGQLTTNAGQNASFTHSKSTFK
ncbi:MAG: hypothetical protein LIP01_15765 [Tannerellaceae bacterium]|nr:hypothetical protein [Tannerellaceae bacterium]